MKKRSKSIFGLLLSPLLLLGLLSFGQEGAEAADFPDCRYQQNPAYWDGVMASAGGPKQWFENTTSLPYEIDVPVHLANSTSHRVAVNIGVLKNDCYVVYGSPSDVSPAHQDRRYGEEKYLGFLRDEQTGTIHLFPNPHYLPWSANESVFSNKYMVFKKVIGENTSHPTRLEDLATALDLHTDGVASDFFRKHPHVQNESATPVAPRENVSAGYSSHPHILTARGTANGESGIFTIQVGKVKNEHFAAWTDPQDADAPVGFGIIASWLEQTYWVTYEENPTTEVSKDFEVTLGAGGLNIQPEETHESAFTRVAAKLNELYLLHDLPLTAKVAHLEAGTVQLYIEEQPTSKDRIRSAGSTNFFRLGYNHNRKEESPTSTYAINGTTYVDVPSDVIEVEGYGTITLHRNSYNQSYGLDEVRVDFISHEDLSASSVSTSDSSIVTAQGMRNGKSKTFRVHVLQVQNDLYTTWSEEKNPSEYSYMFRSGRYELTYQVLDKGVNSYKKVTVDFGPSDLNISPYDTFSVAFTKVADRLNAIYSSEGIPLVASVQEVPGGKIRLFIQEKADSTATVYPLPYGADLAGALGLDTDGFRLLESDKSVYELDGVRKEGDSNEVEVPEYGILTLHKPGSAFVDFLDRTSLLMTTAVSSDPSTISAEGMIGGQSGTFQVHVSRTPIYTYTQTSISFAKDTAIGTQINPYTYFFTDSPTDSEMWYLYQRFDVSRPAKEIIPQFVDYGNTYYQSAGVSSRFTLIDEGNGYIHFTHTYVSTTEYHIDVPSGITTTWIPSYTTEYNTTYTIEGRSPVTVTHAPGESIPPVTLSGYGTLTIQKDSPVPVTIEFIAPEGVTAPPVQHDHLAWVLHGKGTVLSEYAEVISYPGDFTPGYFLMHVRNNYTKRDEVIPVFMPKKKCFFCSTSHTNYPVENLAMECSDVSLSWDEHPKEGKPATLTLTVHNTSNATATLQNVLLHMEFLHAGSDIGTYYEKEVDIRRKTSTELTITHATEKKRGSGESLGNKALVYPAPGADGNVVVFAEINANKQTPADEQFVDNRCSWAIPVEKKRNVSVEITEKETKPGKEYPEYAAGSSLQLPVVIDNHMDDSFQTPCPLSATDEEVCEASSNRKLEVHVYDSSGNEVAIDSSWRDMKGTFPVGKKSILLDLSLPSGLYDIEVRAPHLAGEDSYSDNRDRVTIRTVPMAPANTECNLIQQKDTSAGIPHDLAKMCVGHYPNHPSTKVEGGVGSYFYVKYFFFPLPLPNYTVHNEGTIDQTVELTEDRRARGEEDGWLYFPLTKTGRDRDGNLTNPALLPGPYFVGPHEFYHARYRGRLVTEQVDFHFELLDPKDNPIAKGSIMYEVPVSGSFSCIRTDAIDYKDNTPIPGSDNGWCREITFFLPNHSDTDWETSPEEKDKVEFLNPGSHHFTLSVSEHQKYYYQVDNGEEYQGKPGVRWYGSPSDKDGTYRYGTGRIQTKSIYGETYISRHDFKNRVEEKENTYGKTEEVCYHDHDRDFHYWEYNWSNVQRYPHDFKAEWVQPIDPPRAPDDQQTTGCSPPGS